MYIIVARPKEQFNHAGESQGMGNKRALFYSTLIGRKRIYRDDAKKPQRRFKILSFKVKKNAQAICDKINSVYNDHFTVVKKPRS